MIFLRQASVEDIPTIESILLEAAQWMDGAGMHMWHSSNLVWDKLQQVFKPEDFWIATSEGAPAGCMAVVDYDPMFWPDIPAGESLFIHKLAVRRNFAGGAVSSALISHAKRLCAERGINHLRLDTHVGRTKLRAMYERNGFACVREATLFGSYATALYACNIPPRRVLVAMSGGIDSSVAALLLKQAGCVVEGCTLHLFDGPDGHPANARDIADAREVCERLGIPYTVLDRRELFNREVLQPFCRAYQDGLTPNPCVFCNPTVKFGGLLDYALERGFDYIATGHYARIERALRSGRYELLRASDRRKDQTYMLYTLSQEQLSHVLFPLGGMTKAEAREIAAREGLLTAEKPDSQDICFVRDGDYAGFIVRHTGVGPQEGQYLDTEGTPIGRHKGHIAYTIGQRKGLGQSFGEHKFVLAKDALANTVTLGAESELYSRALAAIDVNLILPEALEGAAPLTAKTRYSQSEVGASAHWEGERLIVEFDTPQRAITPGQSVVLYQGERIVGGGVISRPIGDHSQHP